MSSETCLLVLSDLRNIEELLSTIVRKKVTKTLYIQPLTTELNKTQKCNGNSSTFLPKYSPTVVKIYSQAAVHCEDLDVRVLLSGIKYGGLTKIRTGKTIELVIFDQLYSQSDIEEFLTSRLKNVAKNCEVVIFDKETNNNNDDDKNNNELEQKTINGNNVKNDKLYRHSGIAGTFDHLHVAHKILLSEATLRTSSLITVLLAEADCLVAKTLCELIEPIQDRVEAVKKFLQDICPELENCVVPISEISQTLPSMDLIVVSVEYVHVARMIDKNVDILALDLMDAMHSRHYLESEKVRSTTTRMRLLGTLLKPPRPNGLKCNPYIIGLTGGLGSGKSGIAKCLEEFGAQIISCKKIASKISKNKTTRGLVAEATSRITEKELITVKVSNAIQASKACVIIIVIDITNEDTNLITTLTTNCHEVWTTIVPEAEAVKRLQSRDGLSVVEAEELIASQPENQVFVNKANVVFCTSWTVEYTKHQVDKAWFLLQNRLSAATNDTY